MRTRVALEDYVDARIFSRYMGREIFGSCTVIVFDTPQRYALYRGEREYRDSQVPDITVICKEGGWNKLGTRYECKVFEIYSTRKISKGAIDRVKQALKGR